MKTLEIIICATLYVALFGISLWATTGNDGKGNEHEQ